MSRSSRLENGMGVVTEVNQHHHQSLENQDIPTTGFEALCDIVESTLPTDRMGRSIKASFCAWLNQSFKTSGRLYHVDCDGNVVFNYYMEGSERNVMLSFLDD